MEMTARSFRVEEPTQAGDARRGAMTFARQIGFDEVAAGRVGIVVTEASTNMVKHAKGGALLLHALRRGSVAGIGVLALDRGPGMTHLSEMMRDGYSTTGTSGNGLGAIRRQSSQFDLYSAPGKGTAMLAEIWPTPDAPEATGLAIGAVCVPVTGEELCGDGWAWHAGNGSTWIMVADGLGHGPLARQASACAEGVFRKLPGLPLPELMERLHVALRATRGAAVALVEIVPDKGVVRFCGVGNIAARMHDDQGERSLVSHFGTVGHDMRHTQEFQYPWRSSATLIIHSDGLTGRWGWDDYPGLVQRDPTLMAGVLFRDHFRGRDDCTVVVVRDRS